VFARTCSRTADPVRLAHELVADGCAVAVEDGTGDDAAGFAELIDRLTADGLAAHCEVTLDVDRLGASAVRGLAARTPAIALTGSPDAVDDLAGSLPDARVVVHAGDPSAESRCRALASRRVRLVAGRRRSADLAFVRCLNVLMAADGHPAVAVSGPRLIAIAGERAAWNGRTPDSWEHVLPYRALTEERRRLLAGGYAVRVAVGSRRPGGRS